MLKNCKEYFLKVGKSVKIFVQERLSVSEVRNVIFILDRKKTVVILIVVVVQDYG